MSETTKEILPPVILRRLPVPQDSMPVASLASAKQGLSALLFFDSLGLLIGISITEKNLIGRADTPSLKVLSLGKC